MNVLLCPWCGPRDELEFTWAGEAHGERPASPADVSDAHWADYLYLRANPQGVIHERWCHSYGCRQWFNLVRDSDTHRVHGAYRPGETPPGVTQ